MAEPEGGALTDSFVHLHLHTEYSMLDGASRIGEVVAAAAADGQPAVGITDHGNMYGVLPLYEAAREAGIKPVLGMEGYFTNTSRFDRPKRSEHEIFHLTMLAETNEGYRNLIKVTSAAYLDGYYYKPRSDWELLERHHEGITATTRLPRRPRVAADPDRTSTRPRSRRRRGSRTSSGASTSSSSCRTTASTTTPASIRPLLDIARKLQRAAARHERQPLHAQGRRRGARRVALRADRRAAERPEALQVRRRRLLHQDRGRDARRCSREVPDACDNTLLIAERADVEIEFGQAVLPSFPVPEGHDENSYLRELTMQGAKERYGPTPALHVIERIEYELDVIKSMGFSAYFLVVWDLVRYAKSRGIRVGPGRGSAAGSCVAYCLRIVDIDPIKYDLLFERFLNPGRKQMPDIDMDFDSRYRGEMIRYAAQKYGARPRRADHHVLHDQGAGRGARRGAGARLPLRRRRQDRQADAAADHGPRHAAARVLRRRTTSSPTATRWPPTCASSTTIDPDAKRVVDVARGLEGLRRQDGIHAAAVVITREPLTEYLPIQRKPEPGTRARRRADGHAVRDARRRRPRPVEDGLPRPAQPRRHRDRARPHRAHHRRPGPTSTTSRSTTRRPSSCCGGPTRSACSSSRAGRCARCCARSRPTTFEDVAAVIALYRPGPMAQNWHNEYADRKNGRKPVTFDHPDLEEILGPTFGLMIYQEQLMRVSQKLAGYSLEEADNLRKATGKKIRELIAKERAKFVEGCVAQRPHRRVRGELLRHDRAVRRLLVQQVAQRRLRLHHVPDRVVEGEPPGAVPRGAAHEREDATSTRPRSTSTSAASSRSRCSSPT